MSSSNIGARVADKTGVIGAIVAAMGCATCFPAIASFGAAIGLGFLSQYEGVLVQILLPLFALIALVANVIGGIRHRYWPRMVLGLIGPILVLVAAIFMSSRLLYSGLALMVIVSIWDIAAPAHRRCGPNGCEVPAKRG